MREVVVDEYLSGEWVCLVDVGCQFLVSLCSVDR
jgi:hypothetical protein